MAGRPLTLTELAKKGFVRNLFQTVVHPGVCSGCAACVLACPVQALEYEADKPVLLDNCIDCQLCSAACPRLEFRVDAVKEASFGTVGGLSDGDIGYYRELVATRSTAAGIRGIAQDGGMVTALLTWAFERGRIDGAIVSCRSDQLPLQPVPTLITAADALPRSAGSNYTYSPNTLVLASAIAQGLSRVAVVGTGCQISGLRQLQVAKSKRLREATAPVALTIGLLCSETFERAPFLEGQIAGGLGVDLEDVVKINIKGRVLVHLRSGELRTVPLKQVRPYARIGCHYCQDFGAEYADISAGGLGLDGWTIATVRTQTGAQYFGDALAEGFLESRPVAECSGALDLYRRLASTQRARPNRPGQVAVQKAGESAE